MRPEDRDPAYLWDMLQAAREVEAMLEDHDLTAFGAACLSTSLPLTGS